MHIHYSDLAALARCPAMLGYRRAGLPDQVNSATVFGTVMHYCFAAETSYLTYDGIKLLGETAGTTQRVLANTGDRGPQWVDAEIKAFGRQPLLAVTLERSSPYPRRKIVHATAEHRWFVRSRRHRNSEFREVLTKDLKPGGYLRWQFPRSAITRTTPSSIGIAHGVAFGDGTREASRVRVDLWGDKQALFGSASTAALASTDTGVTGTSVMHMPYFFKELPDLDEAVCYLYGWLAGYIATDGCVSKQGEVTLSCADRKTLEFVQLLAMRLGIAVDRISEARRGTGAYPSSHDTSWVLKFVAQTLRPNVLLRDEHRLRYEAIHGGRDDVRTSDYTGWKIVSVEETERMEEVFCAVVPEHGNFVLDDWINVGNCVEALERMVHAEGISVREATDRAVKTFLYYWHPSNVEALSEPVPPDGWLPQQSYLQLRERGVTTLQRYAEMVGIEDQEVLALEFGFHVPVEGTWDDELGEPHMLLGTVDRLCVRRRRGRALLCVEDLKTGKDQTYLRHNLQFTTYAFATLQREFWVGHKGEDGFGEERGHDLWRRFQRVERSGTWINLKAHKVQDAGPREAIDYARLKLCVEQYAALIAAEIFPLSISGEHCQFCPYRKVCGGTGLAPDEDGHIGAPPREQEAS